MENHHEVLKGNLFQKKILKKNKIYNYIYIYRYSVVVQCVFFLKVTFAMNPVESVVKQCATTN